MTLAAASVDEQGIEVSKELIHKKSATRCYKSNKVTNENNALESVSR